jgi:membrane protein
MVSVGAGRAPQRRHEHVRDEPTLSSTNGSGAGRGVAVMAAGLTALLMAVGFTRPRSEASRQALLREQRDRGRYADEPAEIPAKGWKDIVLRIYHSIEDDRLIAIAAGVTYYVLLAIFPAIAALVSVYGLFADPAAINGHLDALTSFLPGSAVDIINEQLTRVASQPQGTLGLTFITGLAVSLWSANAGIKAMFDALNVVYQEKEKRSFLRLNLISLVFTACAIVLLLLAVALVVVVPIVLKFIGLAGITDLLIAIGRWPAFLVVIAFSFAVVYRYGPSRRDPQWRWVSWGSAFAAFGWIGVSALFSWYVANFASYNETYGSLGAVIGFMVWIWLSVIVILVGGKLNAEMEHQTAKDTTAGRPNKPLGRRGAHMADTIGAAQD